MAKESLWSRAFLGMCFSNFFQFINHYILIVTLPIFVVDILNGNDSQAGLAMTFFQAGAVLFRPFAGRVMDAFEKKRVLFVALIVFVCISFLYLGVHGLVILLALRLLHGAGFSMGTTATATLAAMVASNKRKGEALGYFSIFTSLAMVVGPFLGLLVVMHYNFTALFSVCIIFAVFSFLCGNLAPVPRFPSLVPKKTGISFHWKDFLEPKALPASVVGGCLAFVYGGILTFIPIYAKELHSAEFASWFFVAYAVLMLLSRPLVGKIYDRMGANAVIYPGIIVFTLGVVVLSQVRGPLGLLVAGGLIGLGFGALNPSLQTLSILSAPNSRKGLATSTYYLFMDAGIGLGSFVLGLIASCTSYSTMYFYSSLVVAASSIVYYRLNSQDHGVD